MNKLLILVLLGVISCAGGMIYFLHPGGNNLFTLAGSSPGSPPQSTPSAGKPSAAPSKGEIPAGATAGASKPESASGSATGAAKPESVVASSTASGAAGQGTMPAETPKPTTSASSPAKAETPKPADSIHDADLSPSAAHTLRDISVEVFEQQVIVRIEAEGPFPVKTFLLPNPNRLVVDLPGDWSNIKVPPVPQNRLIRSARLGSQSSGPRLVLDLRAPLTSRTVQRPDSNTVEITLE